MDQNPFKRGVAAVLSNGSLRIVVGLAVLVSFLVRFSQSRSIQADYDDGVYWQTAIAIGSGRQAYTEVFHAQPPLFAWLLSLPYQLENYLATVGMEFSFAELAARLVMIAFAMILVATVAGIAGALKGPLVGLLAALIVCNVPLVQEFSYQFGADLPALALASASLYFALRARTATRRWRYWFTAGAMLALAALTKLIAVVVLPAIGLAILMSLPSGELTNWLAWLKRTAAAICWSLLGFIVAGSAVLLAVRPPNAAWQQVFAFHVNASDVLPNRPFDGLLRSTAPWGGPFFAAAILCAVALVVVNLFRRDRAGGIGGSLSIALWTLAVIPFVLAYRPVFIHHLLLFLPPGAVVIAISVTELVTALRMRWRWVGAIAIVAASLLCVQLAPHVHVSRDVHNLAVEACLKSLPRDYEITTDDQELVARAGLRTPPWLVDTSHVRLDAGWLSDAEIIAAAKNSNGILIARTKRLASRPEVLAWAKEYFPVRYDANGYQLRVGSRKVLRDCVGKFADSRR